MNKENTKKEIEEMVSRETRAWDTQDVELLMTIWLCSLHK